MLMNVEISVPCVVYFTLKLTLIMCLFSELFLEWFIHLKSSGNKGEDLLKMIGFTDITNFLHHFLFTRYPVYKKHEKMQRCKTYFPTLKRENSWSLLLRSLRTASRSCRRGMCSNRTVITYPDCHHHKSSCFSATACGPSRLYLQYSPQPTLGYQPIDF